MRKKNIPLKLFTSLSPFCVQARSNDVYFVFGRFIDNKDIGFRVSFASSCFSICIECSIRCWVREILIRSPLVKWSCFSNTGLQKWKDDFLYSLFGLSKHNPCDIYIMQLWKYIKGGNTLKFEFHTQLRTMSSAAVAYTNFVDNKRLKETIS